MRNRNRSLFIVIGGLAIALTAAVVSFAAYVHHHGVVVVEVQERNGTDLRLRVPGALVQAVLPLIPNRIWDDSCGEDWAVWTTVARRIIGEMESCPDFIAVECRNAGECVHVAKEGGHLVVRVDAPGEKVRVSVPLPLVAAILRTVERIPAASAHSVVVL